MKDFSKMKRNFDGVQFAELRKKIDGKYNAVHDELSDCYYNKKPFRTYGILDKATFDKLHGLIFEQREIEFHAENLKQPAKDRIPEEKYKTETDNEGKIIDKVKRAKDKIAELKADGFELRVK